MDNIYVLNYLVSRKGRNKGKLMALFLDFKAALDLVSRRMLWPIMKKRGLDEGPIERMKKIFVETSVRVRIGNEKEVRRGILDKNMAHARLPV